MKAYPNEVVLPILLAIRGGKSVAEASRIYGPHINSIVKWVDQSDHGGFDLPPRPIEKHRKACFFCNS